MSRRQDNERFKDLGADLSALQKPQATEKPKSKPKRPRRDITIHFRASPEEHEQLQQAADKMGLTVSSFVRLAVREKLGLTA